MDGGLRARLEGEGRSFRGAAEVVIPLLKPCSDTGIPPNVNVYHVTSKCVDDQFLWRPSRRTTFLIANVLAATLERFDIGLYAAVVMANHFHLVVRAESTELSAAMQFFKSQVALALNPILCRQGAMSKERFKHQPVLDDATFM